MGRHGIDHHLPNHDQTIIAKAMTSAIFTKTRSTLRSLSRLSSSRSRGSGRFVGIIGSPLRLITCTAYRTSSRYARQSAAALPIRSRERANDPAAGADHARAEGRDRHSVAEAVDVHNRLLVAEITAEPQRARVLCAACEPSHGPARSVVVS